jgi:MazG family protein
LGRPQLLERFQTIQDQKHTIEDLIEIMARLRAENGCPWDREQTLASLKTYLIEETYEVIEAIDNKSVAEHREELGDVLFQIVFQTQITKENNWFDLSDVIDGVARKIKRRHPHVFGDEKVSTCKEVVDTWERVKKQEKQKASNNKKTSVLDGVPQALPALLATHKLSERAARIGFDWENSRQVLEKLNEELGELKEAIEESNHQPSKEIAWELGDCLFAIANLARHFNFSAEELLVKANKRFNQRFREVEKLAAAKDIPLASSDIETLESLWQEAKSLLENRK